MLFRFLFDFWPVLDTKSTKNVENGTKLIAHLIKKKSQGKPNHQPRHQFLTTSATPPAANQQGLTNCPDLPMSSSPTTLPSEWAGDGSGSAGSICRAPLRARRVEVLCRFCRTSCRRPDMLVMSLSPLLGQAIPDIAKTADILVFPRRGARSGSSSLPKPRV